MKNTFVRGSIVLVLMLGTAFYFFYLRPRQSSRKTHYTYTMLFKGNIESIISSTGTLEAINTIQVGTQISGTIKRIYVDYNDLVKAGQLLAEMDIKQLTTTLGNARANLAVMEVRVQQAKEEFERNKALLQKKVITEKEYRDSHYAFKQASSNKMAAEETVKGAEVNLEYAYITSPINGTITERNVEEGQTVAASFATPTLFIIAEDLSRMQILADVDESDIGYIHTGMKVRFTVQTYPERKFFGTVSQIRLEPVRINNVVNYQVVVQVRNEDRLLLPGMTANLDFISQTDEDALMVNNSALRFHPDALMLKQLTPLLTEKARYLPDSTRALFLASLKNEQAFTSGQFRKTLPPKVNGIFYETNNGQLSFDFIRLNIVTGQESSIDSFLTGLPLAVGTKVVNGIQSKK